MDSCEGSDDYITQSKIVPAKSAALVDGKNEPAGEGLPDGWLKEYRPRKNQHGPRVKGDTFYIDPLSGYRFRSLKDVHRYLESGDISQCFKLPNKRKIGDLHTEGDQSHHTGKLSDHTQLDTVDESNRYDLPKGTNALEDAVPNPESGENVENVTFTKPDDINLIQREADQVEASEGKSIQFQSGSIQETPGEAKFVTRKGANAKEKPKEKKRKTKPIKGIAVPLRSSPRLAALKISQEANNTPSDGHNGTQKDITNEPQPKQIQKPRQKTNSSVLPERKDGESTRSSAENLPSVPNQTHGASFPRSSGDAGCQNAPGEAPVPRQQAGQGETSDGLAGSSLSSLFQHVWSDPCLVFAFRTLLGDIPVLDDARAYRSSAYDGNRDYYLPPHNMNKNAAANWSASAYDSNRNHTQVNHVMPRSSDRFYGSGWFPPQ